MRTGGSGHADSYGRPLPISEQLIIRHRIAYREAGIYRVREQQVTHQSPSLSLLSSLTMQMPGVTVKDVCPHAFVTAFADYLKQSGKIEVCPDPCSVTRGPCAGRDCCRIRCHVSHLRNWRVASQGSHCAPVRSWEDGLPLKNQDGDVHGEWISAINAGVCCVLFLYVRSLSSSDCALRGCAYALGNLCVLCAVLSMTARLGLGSPCHGRVLWIWRARTKAGEWRRGGVYKASPEPSCITLF